MFETESDELAGDEISQKRLDEAVGLGAIFGALVLYFSIGNWPPEFYSFFRVITFPLSIWVAYWAWQRDRKGWLVFATIGAMLFVSTHGTPSDRSWDLVGIVYSTAYGLLGISLVTARTARLVAWGFGLCAVAEFALAFYVNRYMPHGPKYPSGEVVCQNDGRGPCGERMIEDMSNLDIPDWAKFLRETDIWAYFFFVGGTVFAYTRSQEAD